MDKLVFVTRCTRISGKGHFYRVLRMAEVLAEFRSVIIVVDDFNFEEVDGKFDVSIKRLDTSNPSTLIAALNLSRRDIIWFDVPDADYDMIGAFGRFDIPLVSMNMFDRAHELRLEDISIHPVFAPNHKEIFCNGRKTVQLSGADYITVPNNFFCEVDDFDDVVLVTMGGTDPMKFTSWVIRAISLIGETSFQFKVILPDNLCKDELSNKYRAISHMEFYEFGELDFATELKRASYALINGGMTRYECVAANTFFIALSIHAQQVALSEKVTKFNYGHNFGLFDENECVSLAEYLCRLPKYDANARAIDHDSPVLIKNAAALIYERILMELNNEDE